MLTQRKVVLTQTAQRLEFNAVQVAVTPSIVDRFVDNAAKEPFAFTVNMVQECTKLPPGMCHSRLECAQDFVQGKGAGKKSKDWKEPFRG